MLKIQFKAPKFMWNSGKFNSVLHAQLRVQIRQAAREFVRAAVVNIPIDTGQARGTFLPIGRFLNVSVPISGNTPLKNKNPETGADYQEGDPKSNYGEPRKLIFTFPGNQYGEYFQIDVQLFYFWFNDFFSNKYGGPWDSIEEGRKAFIEYMRTTAVKRLPKLKDFIEVSYSDTSYKGDFL